MRTRFEASKKRVIPALSVAMLALSLSACCQLSICRFEVSPPRVCPGGTVTLSWDTGSAPAQIEPGLGALPAGGERTISVASTTDFTLRGTYEGVTQSLTSRVTVTDGATSVPILRTLPACDPTPTVSVELAMPSEGSRVRAVSVTNGGRDPVVVEHAGVTDAVASGQTSAAFSATPLGGPWVFRTINRRIPSNCTATTVIPDPNDPPPHLVVTIGGAC